MILDVINGWFSINFIHNVVKNSGWIHAFVYINSASLGITVWFLFKPLWIKRGDKVTKNKLEIAILWGLPILAIGLAVAFAPVLFHTIHNPFIKRAINKPNKTNLYAKSKNIPPKTKVIEPVAVKTENNTTDSSFIPSVNTSINTTLDKHSETKDLENSMSHLLLHEFTGIVGDDKLSLFIVKVENENVIGLIKVGEDNKALTGRIENLRSETSDFGKKSYIMKLALFEVNNVKGNGNLNIYLWLSEDHVYGKGRWSSYDQRIEREINITGMQ